MNIILLALLATYQHAIAYCYISFHNYLNLVWKIDSNFETEQ